MSFFDTVIYLFGIRLIARVIGSCNLAPNRVLFLSIIFSLSLIFVTTTTFAQSNPSPPTFSVGAGFFDTPQALQLLHQNTNVEIWYTTDGSVPFRNGVPGESAVKFQVGEDVKLDGRFQNRSRLANIATNTIEARELGFAWQSPVRFGPSGHVVRAVAKDPAGRISSEIIGSWFIDLPNFELPIVSLVVDPRSFFDPDSGIYVPGNIYSELGYGYGYWGEPNANYFQRGDEWEREARFSYFVDRRLMVDQAIGVRMHGAGSRALPMKSLRLYARESYGKSTLDFPFFGEDSHRSYKRLILRNSGQDFYRHPTMMKDVTIQKIISNLRNDTQKFQPTVVFLNGEFWGIHNLRERFDRFYFEQYYGVSQEHLDLLENNAFVDEGSNAHYLAFLNWLGDSDLNDADAFAHIDSQIDTHNYIDYLVTSIFVQKNDWPGNNVLFWRSSGPFSPSVPETDGRWRWQVFDSDSGFNNPDENILNQALVAGNDDWPNPDWSTYLFRTLLQNPIFRDAFINRFLTLMYTDFRRVHMLSAIHERAEAISKVMPYHAARWDYPTVTFTYPRAQYTWEDNVDILKDFARNRHGSMRDHLREKFGLRYVKLETIINQADGGVIRINGSALNELSSENGKPIGFTGFWASNQPIIFEAEPAAGQIFQYWRVDHQHIVNNRILQINPTSDTVVEAIFVESDEIESELVRAAWIFDNSIPNNTSLTTLSPYHSTSVSGLLTQYIPAMDLSNNAHETEGIMDRVNDPTLLNFPLLLGVKPESEIRGIRVRNPSLVERDGEFHESSLVFHLPTSALYNPRFSFAAKRTANGQNSLRIDYSVTPDTIWIPYSHSTKTYTLSEKYYLYSFSFSGLADVDNNPHFRVRIKFGGPNTTGNSGNVRFNNIVFSGFESDASDGIDVGSPVRFSISQNYPNPFNPRTSIRFDLPYSGQVRVEIFTIEGKLVQRLLDGYAIAGEASVPFDGSNLASGLYLYRVTSNGLSLTGKMTLLK